ncbi:MAG: hypothetical protein ACLGHN_01035 [Bacteriovoracia bacterium]
MHDQVEKRNSVEDARAVSKGMALADHQQMKSFPPNLVDDLDLPLWLKNIIQKRG